MVLNNVSIATTGTYKCELVAEYPSFEKDTKQHNLTVICK